MPVVITPSMDIISEARPGGGGLGLKVHLRPTDTRPTA